MDGFIPAGFIAGGLTNAELGGPFGVIVADPPWAYSYNSRTSEKGGNGWRGGADRQYPLMSMAEIKELPVKELAAPDSVLWLWVVNAMLPRCLEVLPEWGFEYRNVLTWVKTTKAGTSHFGLGQWMRGATEHVVLATRGKPQPLRRDVTTWFSATPQGHSVKPEYATDVFMSLAPGPYLEMFARAPRAGWVTWGNQAQGEAVPVPYGQRQHSQAVTRKLWEVYNQGASVDVLGVMFDLTPEAVLELLSQQPLLVNRR